ncbi:uncharacterized protein EDB91DRAFT_1245224 [Suillus paluster]|uniref:uncharacterized protein n=1 Tax=Suillus paluster TaxID=48578 RepID=UPI001B880144|nr:uncharacterized protein EDB91DRAFT_1245224 [Suillus paluster]KAG1747738.1 hypothetical protein EDB91DRAFT_1245224 [Suillus paluster]
MNRAATQSGGMTQTAANCTYTQKCGRCPAVIEYDAHADWPTVSRLVNEHWATCPSKLSFHGPSPFYPPSESHETQNAPSPPHDVTIESLAVDDSNHDDPFIIGCGKQRKSEGQRKQELEDDEYTCNVQPTSVRCRGCDKEISLDKRSRYYPGLWAKHKRKCPAIQRTEKEKLTRSARGFCPLNAERRPTAASSFEIDNRQADGMARAANSVEHDALRQMELSSDDDSNEGDQNHIPFSTLNMQYYNECLKRGERSWTYRYASTKEIMEKVFDNDGS